MRSCTRFAKIICCIICTLTMLFSLCSCFYGSYRGEYTDMYTVAVNNIFGIKGYESNGEALRNPDIHILETDSYGRTLFFYSEHYGEGLDYSMAFVIMQKSEDGYVYYYRDKCYIPYYDTTDDWDIISEKTDTEALTQLKELNDWDKELDADKCTGIKISGKKSRGELRPASYEFDEIIYPYEVEKGYTGEDTSFHKFSLYCESDPYGRELHYAYAMTMNEGDNGEKVFGEYKYAIIFNADGSCFENGIARINDIYDTADIISTLKENTGWNMP